MRNPKVSIIGAGSVGATLAMRILESDLADVVMVDIAGKMAKGKALDLLDAAPIAGHGKFIKGSGDYADIASSDIVVITAGFARRPGMTREELISKNRAIVRDVSANVRKYAPDAIVVVVTNPLDAMTYEVYKTTGFGKKAVMGMAGVLDTARFTELLSEELKVPRVAITTYVLGSHGDTMVPVISQTMVKKRSVDKMLPPERLKAIIERTRNRGAEIVECLGTGSAYYSPSAAVFEMVRAILKDTKETLVVSAYLEGEYGQDGIFIGVPCRIGRRGIEEVVVLEMSEEENAAFARSAQAIKNSMEI